VLQLLWINVIMDTLASIALCSEPPRPGLMRLPPKKRDENIVTPAMVGTIVSTAGFFVVTMLGLLLALSGASTYPGGLFFTVYVFFQVWNLINCRSLAPETSGLSGILKNPTFVAIAAIVAIGQIIIVTLGGSIFKVEPLGPLAWLAIIAGTSSVLVFGEVVRRVRMSGQKAREISR
jgi:P-type Ca2+ transporter type 2C